MGSRPTLFCNTFSENYDKIGIMNHLETGIERNSSGIIQNPAEKQLLV